MERDLESGDRDTGRDGDAESSYRNPSPVRATTSIRDFASSLHQSERRSSLGIEGRRSHPIEPWTHDVDSVRIATPPRQSRDKLPYELPYKPPSQASKRSIVDEIQYAVNASTGLFALGDKLDQLPLYLHREDIFMDNDAKDGKPRKLVLSVAALSRMRLRKLQCRLARNIIYMQTHDKEPDDWEENLSKYVAAIRDNDFIVAAVDRSEDPFIIHSGRAVDAEVLKLALQNRLDSQDDWKDVDFGQAADHDKPLPIGGGTRRQVKAKEKLQNFFARLTLGVIGGAFLVGPMWLMVLHDTKITKLVSTTVFVFAFGILMSWRLNDSFGVLSATAAYAAVLVVFVGANN